MSRLIDADKLIEELKNLAKGQISSCPNIAEFFVSIRVDRIIDILNSQPTAFDIDDILRQCKDNAIQLMNKQYNEDEYHMFSKGVQAMYLGVEKIIKEGGLDD